ncbi:uncharacterized protein LOC131247434 [Magnolia sinica]|uniref:uncharacterized protein LOC131247434 n=1 Tax=Magnolia sinica TaxID=86752 RepID=UPI00265A7807|nr:uncharacterized protein LOC131247434 [Magnolia sinica]
MLFTRETFGQLPDDMDLPIKELIESANIDPTVKGGLSWPPGKECIGDRFLVGAVWHDKYKVFKGPTMTLKLRYADRNDFTNSKKRVVVKEVVVKMTEITKQLKDGKVPGNEAVNRMFEEQVKLVWEKLLINHNRLSP